MFELTINRARRLVVFRAQGTISVEELKQVRQEAIRATDAFRGEPHIVLADMRGMATMSPEATQVFADIIRYGREHGVVRCAHLSDSSIARLQAQRLAREASTYDDITVNVISLEEAERMIDEFQPKLRPGKAS
jgi:hypothetical protein